MTQAIDYTTAHWHLYAMAFNGIPRINTFRKLVALGISRREAAEMIQACDREG